MGTCNGYHELTYNVSVIKRIYNMNLVKAVLTGSTLSQLLYFPMKSKLMTWPQTDVNLNRTVSPVGGNLDVNSWMEQALLTPFLCELWPFDRIFANEAAKDGFSATIKAVFMINHLLLIKQNLYFTQILQVFHISPPLTGCGLQRRIRGTQHLGPYDYSVHLG